MQNDNQARIKREPIHHLICVWPTPTPRTIKHLSGIKAASKQTTAKRSDIQISDIQSCVGTLQPFHYDHNRINCKKWHCTKTNHGLVTSTLADEKHLPLRTLRKRSTRNFLPSDPEEA